MKSAAFVWVALSVLAVARPTRADTEAERRASYAAGVAHDQRVVAAIKKYDEASALAAAGKVYDSQVPFNECVNLLNEVGASEDLSAVTVQTASGSKSLADVHADCKVRQHGNEKPVKDPTLVAATSPDGPSKTKFACGEPIYMRLGEQRPYDFEQGLRKVAITIDDQPIEMKLPMFHVGGDSSGMATLWFLPAPASVPADAEDSSYKFYDVLSHLPPGRHKVRYVLPTDRTDIKQVETRFEIDCSSGAEANKAAFDKLRAAHLATVKWLPTRRDLKKWETQIIGRLPSPYGMGDVRPVIAAALDQRLTVIDRGPHRGQPAQRLTVFGVGYVRDSDSRCFVVLGQLEEIYDLLGRRYNDPTAIVNPGEYLEIDCRQLGKAAAPLPHH